jgi:hypothetical protein
MAQQCRQGDGRLADWVVCETIANGSRRPAGRLGGRGGLLVRFEKTFPRVGGRKVPPGARAATVAVLGEMVGRDCVAIRLLSPAAGLDKIWEYSGFLNRSGSK